MASLQITKPAEQRHGKKRVRIRSVGRLVAVAFISGLLVGAVLGWLPGAAGEPAGPVMAGSRPIGTDFKEVQVEPGDTLWSLARRHGNPEEDVRFTVAMLQQVNSLDSCVIQPGQILRITGSW